MQTHENRMSEPAKLNS